ncbi:Hypothetical protein NTJ_09381 [Nesidiocoris tenuis]|uniref:palmitoyl-protein hydrolase n=1 Tax=Nesidiocoris tenuis TaxID=355587 RepID=A0ABN7AWM5_9HEMI|nr:Hypothetical protein NTJ_09381 [Nesidiocoris tenuis]
MIPRRVFGDLRSITNIYLTKEQSPQATGALILLHGSGDNGDCFRLTVDHLLNGRACFPHIKIIYPSAWTIPYSPSGGIPVPTWFDVSGYAMEAEENEAELRVATRDLLQIIDKLGAEGIPRNRIVIGGFSRGGAMAAHLALCSAPDLAGVGVMSSWIPSTSNFYQCFPENLNRGRSPQLLQMHGDDDDLIDPSLAQQTFAKLRSLGVHGNFLTYPGQNHEVSRQELEDFFSFVSKLVPE